MDERRRRPTTRVLLLAPFGVVVLVLAAMFVRVADDRGSAAVGALGIAVALFVAAATVPDVLRWFHGGRPSSGTALRAHAIERSAEAVAHRMRRMPPQAALAVVTVSGHTRVRGRTARAGTTSDLAALFDSADGRLVLVGEPGSGKSTALTQLGDALLQRAKADQEAPVPLLVSLVTWQERPTRWWRRGSREPDPFAEWLIDQCALMLGVSRQDARRLIPSMVPVLDGLDEVVDEQRAHVARAIERFVLGAQRAPFAVSCRHAEFQELTALRAESVPVYGLDPLDPTDLEALFDSLDPVHWRPVVAALQDERSPLAVALSTPLMLTVAIEAWGSSDPSLDVPSNDATVEEVRSRLWESWVKRAALQARDGALGLATALARSSATSGASDVRFETLGERRTRRLWWVSKGLFAAGFLSVAMVEPFAALLPFAWGFASAYSTVLERFVGPHLRGRSPFLRVTGELVLLLPLSLGVGLLGGWLSNDDGAVGPAIALLVITAGVLVAWADVLPTEGEWLRRWQPEPFARARLRTQLLVGLFALTGAILSWHYDALHAVAMAAALVLALPAADYTGHHWLARGWYRWQGRGGPLPDRVSDLVRAGFLRRTSDACRFFHLELQRHLAVRPGPLAPHRLANVDIASLLRRRALDYLDAGEHEAAEEAFRRAINADPTNPTGLGNYAQLLHDLGKDPERAEDLFERSIAADPKDALVLPRYALFLSQVRNDPDRAETLFQRAVAAQPTNASAVANYALFLNRTRHAPDRAEELHRSAVSARPNDAALLANYALFLDNVRGDHDRAEELYQRAIAAGGNHPRITSHYAVFLSVRRKQMDQAEELHARALAADPSDVQIAADYAVFVQVVRRDMDRADDLYQRAIRADPAHVPTLDRYAHFLKNVRRDLVRAEGVLERAIAADPGNTEEASNYAVLLDDQDKDPDRAEELHQRAIAAAPSSANRTGNYARHCAARRRWDDVERLSTRALQTIADGEEPVALECWFYLWVGRVTGARENALALLEDGCRSPGWHLQTVLDAAKAEDHPDLDELVRVAQLISG